MTLKVASCVCPCVCSPSMAIPKVGPPLGDKMGVSIWSIIWIFAWIYQNAISIFTFLTLVWLVNFSSMSPTLLLTYPHRDKDEGIAMAMLFLRLVLLKALPIQLKIFVNLTFSPKVWPFCLFWFTLSWAETALSDVSPAEKKWHFSFVVAKMSIS